MFSKRGYQSIPKTEEPKKNNSANTEKGTFYSGRQNYGGTTFSGAQPQITNENHTPDLKTIEKKLKQLSEELQKLEVKNEKIKKEGFESKDLESKIDTKKQEISQWEALKPTNRRNVY